MKSYSILVVLTALTLTFAAGCNKQESAPAPAAEMQKPAPSVAADVQKADDALRQQATATQQAAQKSAADVQAQATATAQKADKMAADTQAGAASISSQAQVLIDQTRSLLANNNWSEALKNLSNLSSLKLTPEQQATVDALKKQAEKLAQNAAATKTTDEATKALGGALNKK